MAWLALVVVVAWLVIVTGVRTAIAYRRTGTVPTLVRAPAGSPAWWAKLVSSVGLLLTVAAPIAELAGLGSIAPLDHQLVRYGGLALALISIGATLAAQLAMGESWRGDVDPAARTPLVTDGPFRAVRNPVLACTTLTVLGVGLMVPNIVALLALAACVAGIQIQVRAVEEPYLAAIHGRAYLDYASRTGRFLPGIGRLRGP